MSTFDRESPPDVAIVGAGLMGRGIAQIAAQAGCRVQLLDDKPGAAEEGRVAVGAALSMLATKGRITSDDANAAVARITVAANAHALAASDLVIEAIVERLDAKQALFRTLDDIVQADAILATNTSSLSVTAIAAVCARPQRVAGLHFFSPVPLMKVVEVIDGARTAPHVAPRLVDFAKLIGHTPVRAKDTPGFVVNHAGRGYGTEALRIAGEGVADFATIDRILTRAAGFRMGPFELFDLTGLDVSHPVMESIYRQFYDEPRFRPSPITAQRLAAGLLGRKTRHGFYEYSDTGEIRRADPPPVGAAGASPIKVWISAKDPDARNRAAELVARLGGAIDNAPVAAPESLCLVMPLGADATSACLGDALDATRTIALDTLFDLSEHRTLMATPVTSVQTRAAALALFGADGVPVDMIRDSAGFVAQRVVAHIVNVGCDIAQQRIATPADIDLAVRLGLGYPQGPLAWGERIGAARVLAILREMARLSGDPRYRPSPWLVRRAGLGASLLTPEP